MRKLVSIALLGLATSAGPAFATAAHADAAGVQTGVAACVDSYQAGALSARGLDRCIDAAIWAARAAEDSTVNAASLGSAANGGVNTAVLGRASDGGVNTGVLGQACGEGSVNTAVLGSAGC